MDNGIREKTVLLKELDFEILRCLYKAEFMTAEQLSIMTGENPSYIRNRCLQLCQAGLIKRKTVRRKAVNYITKKGIKEAGLSPRNIHDPKLSRYEHNLGFMDVCTWFALWRKFKDGSYHSWIPFGQIITERDFNAAREMSVVKYRADGQPIYVSADKNIHAPDGYFRRPDGSFAAIEYERTQKSSNVVVMSNIKENMKRFRLQYWVFDDPYVGKVLHKLQAEIGPDRMLVYDIRKFRSDLDRYIENIPKVISAKSGVPRRSCLGSMVEPIPLNRIPLTPDYQRNLALERR
ncbi:MAG: hypothetical protein K6E62_11755 [Lachnospiraceae bacterium]|nr:hypothetical protein [Lachnospiraceae bacterium]